MIRVIPLAALLLLAGCGQIGAQIAVAGLSYVASVNNLGAETLKFIDDKDTKACRTAPAPAP